MTKHKKNITVQDIANHLNTSASTVSRALNNHPKISKKTKEKIWKSAQKMGYLPNIPVYMQKQKNNIIIILVDNLQKISNQKIIQSAQEYLIKKGYQPMITFLSENNLINEKLLNVLQNIDTAGVISLLEHTHLLKKTHQSIIDYKFPLVVVNKSNSKIPYANILPDIYNGAYLAVNHLIKRGAKNIALITGNTKSSFNIDLQNGFNAASKPIASTHFKVIACTLKHSILKHEFEQLLNQQIPLDGIITCNNSIAKQLYSFLISKKISVPDQIMIISFGNEESLSYTSPKITAIEYSLENMGLIAAKKIEKAIKKEPIEDQLLIEPVKLIIRSSSMRVL